MLLLGIDLGTSSVKVSIIETSTRICLASARYPETEADIVSLQPGWAEQSPELWWYYVQEAILLCHRTGSYDPKSIAAIGISYQMHGLVLVDQNQQVLCNSIIWCDGRAVALGDAAFEEIGAEYCLSHLLNSPGNFTASKLAWVKEHEPSIYERVYKAMLPGDFISMKFTSEITSSAAALSEGVFWDFKNEEVSDAVMNYFGFSRSLLPDLSQVFAVHGRVKKEVATLLGLEAGIPVSYKAGDQPNNAFSLNVSNPGEVAATAGTSGVIYGVSDQATYDPLSRINSFAHVNHEAGKQRIGVLLCINGVGIFNKWMRNIAGAQQSYENLNATAAGIPQGSDGLLMLPFGNGPERMLNNKSVGAHFHHLDFNIHTSAHLVRAAQEGVAFAFRYGLDIMRANGMEPSIIRAGRANMFLSDVFTHAFVNATGVPVQLYQTDGSIGAALGAGVGAGFFSDASDAFAGTASLKTIQPTASRFYDERYSEWKSYLELILNKTKEVRSPVAV